MRPEALTCGVKWYGGAKGHGRYLFKIERPERFAAMAVFGDDDDYSETPKRMTLKSFAAWVSKWEAKGNDPRWCPARVKSAPSEAPRHGG